MSQHFASVYTAIQLGPDKNPSNGRKFLRPRHAFRMDSVHPKSPHSGKPARLP